MKIFDTHIHLCSDDLPYNISEEINRAFQKNITNWINVGYDYKSSLKAIEQLKEINGIYTSAGLHPNYLNENFKQEKKLIEKLFYNNKNIVAVGETGLDYYRNIKNIDLQKEAFVWHINLAKELNLPLIIHNRDAQSDIIKILKEERAFLCGGVLHMFSGDLDMAKSAIDMNFYLGFGGNITFKNSTRIDIIKNIPETRILIETDSPYVSPVPFRGKPNLPYYIIFTLKKLSEILELSEKDTADLTYDNAKNLFKIRNSNEK